MEVWNKNKLNRTMFRSEDAMTHEALATPQRMRYIQALVNVVPFNINTFASHVNIGICIDHCIFELWKFTQQEGISNDSQCHPIL